MQLNRNVLLSLSLWEGQPSTTVIMQQYNVVLVNYTGGENQFYDIMTVVDSTHYIVHILGYIHGD